MEINIQHYLTKAMEQQDSEALQLAYHLIKDFSAAADSRQTSKIVPELYVICAEAALRLQCFDMSKTCLKMYFVGNPQTSIFLCRAYLCQGQLKCLAFGNVEDIQEGVNFFLKAIAISKHEPRYHFMVFNASVLYFKAVRPLLLPTRCIHLVPSLKEVVQSLEEVADQDHGWRAELLMQLIKCLVDSDNTEEAAHYAKVTEELIKSHAPQLYSNLFVLLVQHSLTDSDVITELIANDITLSTIYKIEVCKMERKMEDVITGGLKKEFHSKLEEIFCLLAQSTNLSTSLVKHSENLFSIHPVNRVAFLLELALLAIQVKHQKVAANCLKELKLAKEVNIGQRIMMKCVKSEITLLKKGARMNNYSRASVEVRLKEIGKLDHWLKTAVSAGFPQAVQAVCAVQWTLCLPLLQQSLRKYVKTPLLRVVQELENIQSLLLEMRCQIHSELAVIDEEEGSLETSVAHIQKALHLYNGGQHERLLSALQLLQLRKTPYQALSRAEDKAAMLMQQTREKQPQRTKAEIRSILISAGLLLGPDDFQVVLDGDNIAKIPSDSLGSDPAAHLSAKVKHFSESLQRVRGHLTRQPADTDSTEKMNLWATLAKIARKYEAWDVCRAACQFCLLYDNKGWSSGTDDCECTEDETCAECRGCQSLPVRDYMRLLAEIYLISAEATVHKLLTEGFQLNSPALHPQELGICISKDDPHWIIYSDWIQGLSAYATTNFLRGADLGLAIMEPCVVANAAIYIWNYNSHLLVAGEVQHLLATFQSLLGRLRKLECPGNHALVVLMCNAVARGLIEPLYGPDGVMPSLPAEKGRKTAAKGKKKPTTPVQDFSLDAIGLSDVNCALELCDYALHIADCNVPGIIVPIAVKKQVVATWVQTKMMLQQQISAKSTCKYASDEISESNLLAILEMHRCNKKPRHMDFATHDLSTLVTMVSECKWTDTVVELLVWCQLATLCYSDKDHDLVMRCSARALKLEDTAVKDINTVPCALYDLTTVNVMLSNTACLRGLSLVHKSKGNLNNYKEAMRFLLSGVRYAEKAKNPKLCITAARHYWNTCLPLTQSAEERWKLRYPLEEILNALVHTTTKYANQQVSMKASLTATAPQPDSSKQGATVQDDIVLKAAIYSLLLRIHIDKTEKKSALQLLNKAISNVPLTAQTIHLLRHCMILKARLEKSVFLNMQKLREEEQSCALMWHQVALSAGSITHQLTCYQKSISALLSIETEWQKVNLVLELGEWLYCHNFSKASAQHLVQWAIDILLHLEPIQAEEVMESQKKELSTLARLPMIGVPDLLFRQDLSDLHEVRRLDNLVRAHTLLAVMAGRGTPEHQINLLRAYTFVLQIWQVSMAEASEMLKPPPTAGSKKGTQKGKVQRRGNGNPEDRLDQTLPCCPGEWAGYICPDQARIIFRANKNQHCINTYTITNQTQSIFYLSLLQKELNSIALHHLTLPVMHLAETIAHDLLNMRSLSNLYQIKIFRMCCQLGLETCSPYQKKLLDLCKTNEQELIKTHKTAVLSKEMGVHCKPSNQKTKMENSGPAQKHMSAQDIMLDKAEICLSMELHQPARQLLADAHMVARQIGDQRALARSLLNFAILACKEQNHDQALILLDKAQVFGGDEEFWYQFTLTKVNAVIGQRQHDTQSKVDQIIKEGCLGLKILWKQQSNRATELTFLITSLEMRSTMECIGALVGGEPVETLCYENLNRLMAVCDRLIQCATNFLKLGYRQQAAEAHAEYAHCLRIFAQYSADKNEKRRFLLSGLSQMKLAVTLQEQWVMNAQSLLPPQQEPCRISLAAMWRLVHLRLALTDFCLVLLEESCAEETSQALAREKMTPGEIAAEIYARRTPEPNSLEQEWINMGHTLGQVILGQLAAISSFPLDSTETKPRCLSLMGKYLRLQAVLKDAVHVFTLWDKTKQREAHSGRETSSIESEPSENGRESCQIELRLPIDCLDLKQGRHTADQLLTQASVALTEAINLCLEHNLPSFILADATMNMLGCVGQSELALTGQYLALFQSCCTLSMIVDVLCHACVDTGLSQLSALLSLHRKLQHSEDRASMLRGFKNSLNILSKACSQLTINPNHLSLLSDLPPNVKILLLQHSRDGSELYGAFFEVCKASDNKKGKAAKGSMMNCSKLAKISVCQQDLLALREQIQAFGQETKRALLKEVRLQTAGNKMEGSESYRNTATDEELAPKFCNIVQDMENYLYPLLSRLDLPCIRPQALTLEGSEITPSKDKKDKQSSTKSHSGRPEYVVLLTDKKLLDLPLESLLVLQEETFCSISRDFSLQLLHSRLSSVKSEKVQQESKKEGKGGKGTERNKKQTTSAIPPYTFPVDTHNFKYIVDSGTSLSRKMIEILEGHGKHLKCKWEGFMGSQQMLNLSEIERLLCKCSAFIYMGKEQLMESIPPDKLAVGHLSKCHLALLFEQVHSNAGLLRQAIQDMSKSIGQFSSENPQDTALLLSMGGVGCVVLNQWQSSLQQNTRNMATILDKLLRGNETFGQIVHDLRRKSVPEIEHHADKGSRESACLTDTRDDDSDCQLTFTLSSINCIIYGLPNLIFV